VASSRRVLKETIKSRKVEGVWYYGIVDGEMELISTRHLFKKNYRVAKSRRNLILRLLYQPQLARDELGINGPVSCERDSFAKGFLLESEWDFPHDTGHVLVVFAIQKMAPNLKFLAYFVAVAQIVVQNSELLL
jgi:hypothetical protein